MPLNCDIVYLCSVSPISVSFCWDALNSVLTSKFYSVCSILVVFLLAKNLIKRDSIHDLKQDIGGDDPL